MTAEPELPDANARAPYCYVLSAMAACPHCGFETRVFALGLPARHRWLHTDDEDAGADAWQSAEAPAVLFHVAAVSGALAIRLAHVAPGYRPGFAPATDRSGWINHCAHCDGPLEDDDLHCEPEAAFLPISPAAARRLRLTEVREPIQVHAAGFAPDAHWLAQVPRD